MGVKKKVSLTLDMQAYWETIDALILKGDYTSRSSFLRHAVEDYLGEYYFHQLNDEIQKEREKK